MVLLSLFLLAGIDEAINPPRKRTIAKRVKLGLTPEEQRRLFAPVDFTGRTGIGVRRTKRKGRRTITF